MNEKDLKN